MQSQHITLRNSVQSKSELLVYNSDNDIMEIDMKKIILILFSIGVILISLPSHAFLFQTKCGVPKAKTVCQRHCCYNYYGPGAKCTEVCTRVKLSPQTVCHRTGLFDS